MCSDHLIHEIRRPGNVIEQRLLAADAPEYLGTNPKDRSIRKTMETLHWEGLIVARVNGKPARCWRRYVRVVSE